MPRKSPPFSQRERWALCDLLTELGPDVPTLCPPWRSADLAAHLVARDRRPDAMPGMTVRAAPFGPWTDRVQQGFRDTMTWDVLVERARRGPPRLLRPFDRYLNTIEYFVHHEDLRRAQEGWEPRVLEAGDETELWKAVRGMKLAMRAPVGWAEAPGLVPVIFHKKGHPEVVRGPVSEIVLWLLGRKSVARVEVSE